MDKANDVSIEALKQILTLASATLALTITFLKDIIGNKQPSALWLLILGWLFLIFCIWVSWLTIVSAADLIAARPAEHVFKRDQSGTNNGFCRRLLSWFIFVVPTTEVNIVRKMAASAQNYFILGLLLVGSFAVINFRLAAENSDGKFRLIRVVGDKDKVGFELPSTEYSGIWTIGNGVYFVLSDGVRVNLWQIVTPSEKSESGKAKLVLIDSKPLK